MFTSTNVDHYIFPYRKCISLITLNNPLENYFLTERYIF